MRGLFSVLVSGAERGQARGVVTAKTSDSDAPDAELSPLRNEDGQPIVSARTVMRARVIAEALFLGVDGPPPPERLDWLAREVEDFLARAGARSRFIFGLALFAIGVLAPLLSFSFVSLGSMKPEERARVLARLEDVFGAPVLAVKALLCVLYYEHPDAARAVGFDGECLVKPP